MRTKPRRRDLNSDIPKLFTCAIIGDRIRLSVDGRDTVLTEEEAYHVCKALAFIRDRLRERMKASGKKVTELY